MKDVLREEISEQNTENSEDTTDGIFKHGWGRGDRKG